MTCCSSNTSVMSVEGRLLHRFEQGRASLVQISSLLRFTAHDVCGNENNPVTNGP